MAHIRAIAELKSITETEQRLIKDCKAGEVCSLGELPEEGDKSRKIRAELLRFLILGGCDDCVVSEGVRLVGAIITSKLDLSFKQAKGQIHLSECRFLANIKLLQTRCDSLILHGSHLKSLNAQGIRVRGDIFLRSGFSAQGEVRLLGARIGGQLNCEGGRFNNSTGVAFNAENIEIKGSVLLWNEFKADGMVSLSNAQIGGQLNCNGGSFNKSEGLAFSMQGINVSVAFVWKNIKIPNGSISLSDAKVGSLVDDLASWPEHERVYLNGFDYARITSSSTDAASRLEWLSRGDTWVGEFFPQPYVHLAKVLREMGHERDARKVLIAKEDLLSKDYEKRDRARRSEIQSLLKASSKQGERQSLTAESTAIFIKMWTTLIWRKILCRLVGNGHAPERAAKWSLYFITASTLFFWLVWSQGGLVPNSPLILNSQAWADALAMQPGSPSLLWVEGEIGQHYETFNPIAYASDIFIPLIELGQESAWTATTVTKLGTVAWIAAWVLKAFGWIVTALAAAAVTGIIKRE